MNRQAQPRNLPPRVLPLVYFAFAHAFLLWALSILVWDPDTIAGAFLQPRTFAVVHAVTLGWITLSILGAFYIVGPLVLAAPMRACWMDGWALGATVVGILGLVTHFWLGSYGGVAFSGGLVLLGLVPLAVKILGVANGCRRSGSIGLFPGMASVNLLLAGSFGVLLAVDRTWSFLPAGHLSWVFAHAHLAAVGWATFMFVGVGNRLLPMFLPARPPGRRLILSSAWLLEAGVLGLVTALALASPVAGPFGLVLVAGLCLFGAGVVSMLRHRKPAPRGLLRPDPGMLHTLQGLLYLLLAAATGLYLAFFGAGEPRWILVYGVFGLLGFLSQCILGVGMRLVPMFAWFEAWAGAGYVEIPPKPYEMPLRRLQLASLCLWTPGVPVLAAGCGVGSSAGVRAGAGLLLLGTLAAAVSTVSVARAALSPRSRSAGS